MIEHVDRAVERFIRTQTPLPEGTAAISFDTPDATWSAARTRPTLSLFLWRIARSPTAPRSGLEQRLDNSGRHERRPKTPVVDLHYLITAWAAETRDEHELLGALLACVLAHSRLPDDVLGGPLAGKRCGIGLSPHEMVVPGEIWQALGGAPRPAVLAQVTLPFEVFDWNRAGPPTERIELPLTAITHKPVPEDDTEPVIVRRRVNGSMVLEGRVDPKTTSTEA